VGRKFFEESRLRGDEVGIEAAFAEVRTTVYQSLHPVAPAHAGQTPLRIFVLLLHFIWQTLQKWPGMAGYGKE